MLTTTPKKRGRPQARYRCRDGTEVQGLTRFSDGRWKISATGQTFVEPDEALAIARFREWQSKQEGAMVDIPTTHATIDEAADAFVHRIQSDDRTYIDLPVDPSDAEPIMVSNWQPSPAVWAWFRQQVLTRPLYVAQMTGIEQIGWLRDLERPTQSPKLIDLIEVYAAKPGLSADEVARCRRFWKEFIEITAITTLRELTHEHVERYEAAIREKTLSPKSIKHRYTRIRTVIAYAMKRGKGQDDCRKALDKLAMLEVEGVNNLDPNPISRTDFLAIHAAALKAGDTTFAALLLMSMNAALYSSEVGAVRWDDLDLERGEYATRRNKTKVPRVAVLWPETIKALKAIPRDRDTVFNTSRQAYKRFSIHREWTKYREAAGIRDGVTFAMIRDAAFTTACRVNLDQARVLAGHRLPGAVDHYVLRQPQYVAPACGAIRDQLFSKGTGKATKRKG